MRFGRGFGITKERKNHHALHQNNDNGEWTIKMSRIVSSHSRAALWNVTFLERTTGEEGVKGEI